MGSLLGFLIAAAIHFRNEAKRDALPWGKDISKGA